MLNLISKTTLKLYKELLKLVSPFLCITTYRFAPIFVTTAVVTKSLPKIMVEVRNTLSI